MNLKYYFCVKILFVILFTIQFCFANVVRNDKKVEFIIDDKFYNDEDVMSAINRYAQVVHQKYGVNIMMTAYPFESIVRTEATMESAQNLKTHLIETYQSRMNGELEGALLIGSLPRALMEYSYWNEDRQRNVYQRWITDYYFMDLNGVWVDSKKYDDCEKSKDNVTYCDKTLDESNGILDGHYSFDGSVSNDFEIWISRVDPYTVILNSNNIDDLYETFASGVLSVNLYNSAKDYLLHWLNKAYDNQVSSNRSRRALFTHTIDEENRKTENFEKFPRGLSSIYEFVDVKFQSTALEYVNSISQDYDWVTFMGHGNGGGLSNNANVDIFENAGIKTPARVFHLASCSPMLNYDRNGAVNTPSIAAAHLFMTDGGGVAVIGASKTSGDNQFDDIMYSAAPNKFLAEAFLEWVDSRANERNNYGGEAIYDWFYAEGFWGDPFVSVDEDDSYDGDDLFMTFNNLNKVWTSLEAYLSYDDSITVGDYGYSLKIDGDGYKTIISPLFGKKDLESISNHILLDIWIPRITPNPYWLGDVQLFVDIPSEGIYNAWVGIALLNDLNDGWNTISFDLENRLYNALNGQYDDARFILAVNTNQGSECYRIDNMRFDSGKRYSPKILTKSASKQLNDYKTNNPQGLIRVKEINQNGVDVFTQEDGWIDISVIDLNGQIIEQSSKIYVLAGENFMKLDFHKVRANRYFLTIKQGNAAVGKMIEFK